MTATMEQVAGQVRRAMASQDIGAFGELLDGEVTWGAPGARNPSCKNRQQVLSWYQRGRDAGVRGSVKDIGVFGDCLLTTLVVRGTQNAQERGGAALRFQVLKIRDGKIVDIAGFDDKAEAIAYVGH